MSLRSVYIEAPSIKDNQIRISGEEHRHLTVARIEVNELLEVFDGRGNIWTAAVETVGKRETIAIIKDSRQTPRDPVELILGLAMIRIAAFELAIEKAVEIGVTRIIPFTAERSNLAPGNRHERWMRILVEASKQSKHYYVPALDPPMTFDQVISIPAASKIMFAEHDGGSLKSALASSPVLYLVGPEGGWSDRELSAARDAGFHAVSLGAAILKAETAAIVGASLIRYELCK
jgi:16S rRNA (uracil1498-N3)-methyltransferase